VSELKRNNPNYPPWHCFTVAECKKCGEWYEPICRLPHICREQNSYPMNKDGDNNGQRIQDTKD